MKDLEKYEGTGEETEGDVQYKLLPNFGTKLQMWDTKLGSSSLQS